MAHEALVTRKTGFNGHEIIPTRHNGIDLIVDGGDPKQYTRIGRRMRVPQSTPSGGVAGEDKWYGIVPGKIYEFDPSLGDFVPRGEYEVIKALPKGGQIEDKPAETTPEPEEAQAQDFPEEPREAVSANRADLDILDELTGSISLQKWQIDKAERRAASIKVTLQGDFGKIRGIYRNIIEQQDMVILIADSDEQIFTPAVREDSEPITLIFNKSKYQTYYSGIEFEVPAFSCVFQVFVKTEA